MLRNGGAVSWCTELNVAVRGAAPVGSPPLVCHLMTSTFKGQECFIWNTWLKNVWMSECCCSSELFPSEVRSVCARVHDWVRRLTQNSWMTWDMKCSCCSLATFVIQKLFLFWKPLNSNQAEKPNSTNSVSAVLFFSLFSWCRLFPHFCLKISKSSKKQREGSPSMSTGSLGWAGWDREWKSTFKIGNTTWWGGHTWWEGEDLEQQEAQTQREVAVREETLDWCDGSAWGVRKRAGMGLNGIWYPEEMAPSCPGKLLVARENLEEAWKKNADELVVESTAQQGWNWSDMPLEASYQLCNPVPWGMFPPGLSHCTSGEFWEDQGKI